MRPIEFKAYCKKEKKMYEWHEIGVESYGAYVLRPGSKDIREFDSDLELIQYIGLRDKNNKKIHDGDLYYGTLMNSQRTELKVVEFKNGGYDLKDGDFAEVVGNIYEHPDLLKN